MGATSSLATFAFRCELAKSVADLIRHQSADGKVTLGLLPHIIPVLTP